MKHSEQLLIRVKPEQKKFLNLYATTFNTTIAETIRTFIDDLAAQNEDIVEYMRKIDKAPQTTGFA